MNGYTCTKACSFGGVTYSIGDAIPFDAVLPSRERALIKQNLSPQRWEKTKQLFRKTTKNFLKR